MKPGTLETLKDVRKNPQRYRRALCRRAGCPLVRNPLVRNPLVRKEKRS
jgi:hypothetical protein